MLDGRVTFSGGCKKEAESEVYEWYETKNERCNQVRLLSDGGTRGRRIDETELESEVDKRYETNDEPLHHSTSSLYSMMT